MIKMLRSSYQKRLLLLLSSLALLVDAKRLNHPKFLRADGNDVVPDEYIVIYKEQQRPEASPEILFESSMASLTSGDRPDVLFKYSQGLYGVAIKGVSEQGLDALLEDENVESVEENTRFSAAVIRQENPPWGLDRIDQGGKSLDKSYSYTRTGEGVQVFILDSGVRITHEEYAGRASCGFNGLEGRETCTDQFGHGSHVAGIVGGTVYGVAKNAELINVKVLNKEGNGDAATIMAGLDYIRGRKRDSPDQPMVVNVSVSGRRSKSINKSLSSVVNAGVTVVGAAGNNYFPACLYTPSSADGVIVVGSTTIKDRKSFFSNWGRCLDIFAPGSAIQSAGKDSDTSSLVLSGTSMAAPHVAGAAALYLEANPTWSPQQVQQALLSHAKSVVRFRFPFSPKILLNTQNTE